MAVREFATPRVITVAPQDSLDKAMTLMEEFGFHHLVVVNGRRVVGMVSDRDLLLAVGWKLSHERQVSGSRETIGPLTVGEIMSQPVECISPDESLQTAIALMLRLRFHALPICSGEDLLGIVTDSDVIRRLYNLPAGHSGHGALLLPLREVMSTRVHTVPIDAGVYEILTIFRKRQVQHVPVVRNGQLRGMISDRDVCRALGESNVVDRRYDNEPDVFFGAQRACDIMTPNPLMAPPHQTVRWAIENMTHRRVHALPVTQGETLVGLVTSTDLLRVAATVDSL